MTSGRLVSSGVVTILALGMWACAAGPGPDLHGPEGTRLTAAYSGDWVLLRTESDNLAAKLRGSSGGRGGSPTGGMLPGGRRGGGMGGGMGGGGVRPGSFPGGGDPEEMRQAMQTMQALSQVPGEMNLLMSPDTVTITEQEPQSFALSLGLNREEQELQQGQGTFFARAKWTEEGLEIDKKVDGGGGVTDKISLDANGRLIMKREIENAIRGKVDGTLVYRRKEAGS
jgi:hypothetical protein